MSSIKNEEPSGCKMLSILETASAIFTEKSEMNFISPADAINEGCVGLRMYDAPIFAVADALDPLFRELRDNPESVGSHYILPEQWLPGARSVISIYLPISAKIRTSNRTACRLPSAEWLHARIEGREFISAFTQHMTDCIIEMGYKCISPSIHWQQRAAIGDLQVPKYSIRDFTSNWSERHTAFICGLGTFGLSKGIITQKGSAGRLTSVITNGVFEPTPRPYSGIYDYCAGCGACAKNCPAGAISLEKGKMHAPCCDYMDKVYETCKPHTACGKCQVGVPCESGIPFKTTAQRVKDVAP